MNATDPGPEEVAGERATTLVNRSASVQSRLSNLLALSLMSVLGIGSLTWYYAHNAARQTRIRSHIQSTAANHAAGRHGVAEPRSHRSAPAAGDARS